MLGNLTPLSTLDRLFDASLDSVGAFANITGSASAFGLFMRSLTSTAEPITVFVRLEALAQQGEAEVFTREMALTDQTLWSAAEYARAIRLALLAGAHRSAVELARRARERYPHDADVHRLADLLAPVPVPLKRSPPDPTLRATRDWFVHNAARYRGQWVAVRNGKLLGAAPTLRELKALVGDIRTAVVSRVV